MGKFEDLFHKEWDKVREIKGLPPKGQEKVQVGPSIIVGGLSPSPDLEEEVYEVPDIMPAMPENPEHREWQETMQAFSKHMEQVYEWSEQQQPGTLAKLGKLEDLCRNAALIGDHEKYFEYKGQYFLIAGKLCEVYLMATVTWDSIDLMSMKLGMKKVRIRLRHTPGVEPEEAMPEFYAIDIPFLLVAKPEQIMDLYRTRSVFPGAQFVSV